MFQFIKFKVRKIWLILPVLFSTVGCDQISKVVIRDSVRLTGPLTYFKDGLRLQYARNPGAFLNLGAELPPQIRFWVFTVSVAVFLLLLAWALFVGRHEKPLRIVGLALILGGGLGNLMDRLARGEVTDFIILSLGDLRTGVFNIADLSITLGAAALALASYKASKGEDPPLVKAKS